MSADAMSQDSGSEVDDCSDEDMEDQFDYYNDGGEDAEMDHPENIEDVESFEYKLLNVEEVERLLNESVEKLCTTIKVIKQR